MILGRQQGGDRFVCGHPRPITHPKSFSGKLYYSGDISVPIYDVICHSCGKNSEVLVISRNDLLICPNCGSTQTTRLVSATSSLTGRNVKNFPGPKDTACCGSNPSQAHCAGPGSCCGKMG
ncbi:MAG: zinc ribbon domain-containing protein [Desulfatirhabdiaceae bacterium]